MFIARKREQTTPDAAGNGAGGAGVPLIADVGDGQEAAAVRAELRLLTAEGVTIADRSAWLEPVRRTVDQAQRTLRRRLIVDRSVDAREQGQARLLRGLIAGLLTFAVHSVEGEGRLGVPVAVGAVGALGRGAVASGEVLELVFAVPSGGEAEQHGRRIAAMVAVALGELGVRVRWQVHCGSDAAAALGSDGGCIAGAEALFRGPV